MGKVEFISRRTRVRNLLFAMGLTMLFCGVVAVQGGSAQISRPISSNDDSGVQAPAQSSGSSASDNNDQEIAPIANPQDPRQPSTPGGNALPSSEEEIGGQGLGKNGNAGCIAQDFPSSGTPNSGAPNNGTLNSGNSNYGTLNSGAPNQNAATASPSGSGCVQGANQRPKNPRPVNMDHQDEPPQIQQMSPYGDLESLRGLYTQVPSTGAKLQRFGSDALLLGTGNSDQLPMDLPAGPDYVLGTGDGLVVNIWGGQTGRLERIIDRQGQIELPETGTIMISGMTIDQAQKAIQGALSKQFQKEKVELSLGRLHTVRVYVVGDVQMPGAYDVSSLSTALGALYAAGGPTSRGSLRVLRQYRGKQLVREIDLYDFLLKGVRSDVERLQPGDTLLVPPAGSSVTVEGMVHRPAIYELNGEKTLSQVLDLAGGTLASASLQQINVARVVANQRHTMLSLQIPENSTEVAQKLAEFQIQGGDDVIISQILPYNQDAVYLEGHVYRPGPYPYKEGMTINDLLRSYQDLMPEPANHVELVRLQPPDFRPETISLNLPDVLIGNNPIPLRPFDLIRVYGRYEIDEPIVSIAGEVLRPGKFPMSQGMTVTQLVQMAGGFKRSAYRDGADLASYDVQDGRKVLLSHREVALQKALDGDKSADVVLKPGDAVSIRRLAGWQDIGATVIITGEVEHNGSYGIEEGEHLSSVLRRAGGFRSDAYPYAAVLERVQVRELNEQAREQMIRRIEQTPIVVNPGVQTGSQTAEDMQKSLELQRQQILQDLRTHPAGGRLVVSITSDIDRWANTPADIEMRAGDTLFIPKKANFVMAAGQVYNPIAISYAPGKKFGWYFHRAGGATPQGNKKELYVLRADGTVVPKSGRSVGSGDFMNLPMRPGDTIFVPEKIQGASQLWQNIVGTAQVVSAITLPLAISHVL